MRTTPLLCCLAALALCFGCHPSSAPDSAELAPPSQLVQSGWKATWSPDGKELAYGTDPDQGIKIMNLQTRAVRTLIADGKDPAWSPDNRWIAYVREPRRDDHLREGIWLVSPDGSAQWHLPRGGFPSWSANGKRLYVHSRSQGFLLAWDLSGTAAKDDVFYTNTPAWYFTVSPDARMVAFGTASGLKVHDRATGAALATYATPGERGLLPAWSPDGRYIAFGGFNDSRGGLRVVELESGRMVTIREGPCTMPAWSPDSRWLAFDERIPGSYSIWQVGRDYILQQFRQKAGKPL